MDDAIQLVGGFGVRDARQPRQTSGDFRFPHASYMVARQISGLDQKSALRPPNLREQKLS